MVISIRENPYRSRLPFFHISRVFLPVKCCFRLYGVPYLTPTHSPSRKRMNGLVRKNRYDAKRTYQKYLRFTVCVLHAAYVRTEPYASLVKS